MCGNYIVGVCSKIMAQIGNPRVIMVLSQVLADLVNGEFQQMAQAKEDESERFETYLSKSFNKTGSLMTYSCEACAILSGASDKVVMNELLGSWVRINLTKDTFWTIEVP